MPYSTQQHLIAAAERHVGELCALPDRRTGSSGNRTAAAYVAGALAAAGWPVERDEFACLDWRGGTVRLAAGGETYPALPGPYTPGCRARAPLVAVSTVEELASTDIAGKIVLLRGAIAAEPLMPLDYPFYNPEEHRRINDLLIAKSPAAIIAATGMHPELSGALYPFPLIEDGNFDIPSAYMKDVEGERLAAHAGSEVVLEIDAARIPSTASNVLGRLGPAAGARIVACAHFDAKEGTPGALDNAAGTAVLLLLAEVLAGYAGAAGVELVGINGEDHYSAGGELAYLRRCREELDDVALCVNVDGAGYPEGRSAYSLYGCPEDLAATIRGAFAAHGGLFEGDAWYQGDHMVFVQRGRPAVAVTSERFAAVLTELAHTPRDRPELVDPGKLVEIALALRDVITAVAASLR